MSILDPPEIDLLLNGTITRDVDSTCIKPKYYSLFICSSSIFDQYEEQMRGHIFARGHRGIWVCLKMAGEQLQRMGCILMQIWKMGDVE